MSLIGANCIGDFQYYDSFIIMLALPLLVVVIAVVTYFCLHASLSIKMTRMNDQDKALKQQEAFHLLFELADADHSGAIDPSELRSILYQLGWKLDLETTVELCKELGVRNNSKGVLMLSEKYFRNVMKNGLLESALRKKQLARVGAGLGSSTGKVRRNSSAHAQNTLTDNNQLVSWMMHRNIVSSSLSGATQLLLLAHTPVSRKVFQFFHCRNIGTKLLLRADYNIDCVSDEYNAFMPLVILTLVGFTVALPTVLSFYLIYHRKNLYSTSVHQKIGWLYDPFVRGAEWWQIHDVLMKMCLTGLLIYVPTASRAGIAALLCMVAIANLNYFHPHKNNILFWLTQLSFLTTGSKYVMGLLLAAGRAQGAGGAYCSQFATKTLCSTEVQCIWDGNEVCTSPLIGNILIALDIVFMSSSFVAVPVAIFLLKRKFDHLDGKVGGSSGVEVYPMDPSGNSDLDFVDPSVRVPSKLASVMSYHKQDIDKAVVHNQVVRFEKSHDAAHAASLDAIRARQGKAKIRLQERRRGRNTLKKKQARMDHREVEMKAYKNGGGGVVKSEAVEAIRPAAAATASELSLGSVSPANTVRAWLKNHGPQKTWKLISKGSTQVKGHEGSILLNRLRVIKLFQKIELQSNPDDVLQEEFGKGDTIDANHFMCWVFGAGVQYGLKKEYTTAEVGKKSFKSDDEI